MSTLAEPAPTRPSRSFVQTRLASLLSFFPLGIWTVNHIWDNLSAFRGAEAWQQAVTEHPHPVAHGLTLTVVLLPLLLHTVWGIRRLVGFKPNNAAYPTYNNVKYLLQRLSAVGVLGFLGAHIWLAMLSPRLLQGRPEPFEALAREMHFHAPTLIVYLLGTLGVAYHLANGLSSFAWTWGLVSGRTALKRLDRVALVSFVLLLGMSWAAIFALYSAGGALGPVE